MQCGRRCGGVSSGIYPAGVNRSHANTHVEYFTIRRRVYEGAGGSVSVTGCPPRLAAGARSKNVFFL